MMDFVNRDFQVAIINMFRELKETMFKDLEARWLWYKKYKKKLQKELYINFGVEKYSNWKTVFTRGTQW